MNYRMQTLWSLQAAGLPINEYMNNWKFWRKTGNICAIVHDIYDNPAKG